MKMRNDRVGRNTLLLALICDMITALASSLSKKPNDVSIVEILNGDASKMKREKPSDIMSYASGKEFEEARAQLLRKEDWNA